MPAATGYADSGSYLTPQSLASRRRLFDAMLGQGINASPVGHWTQGLARLTQAMVGGWGGSRADREEREGLLGLGRTLAGVGPEFVPPFGAPEVRRPPQPRSPTFAPPALPDPLGEGAGAAGRLFGGAAALDTPLTTPPSAGGAQPPVMPSMGDASRWLGRGITPPALPSPTDLAAGTGGAVPPPTNDATGYADAISAIESGSRAGNYGAVGPPTRTGQRAYGRYQVLESNIGPWTERWFGQRLAPEEFLGNREAQDRVFQGQFGEYVARYGPERAARAWYGGPGAVDNPARRDLVNPRAPNVGEYGSRFIQGLGGAQPPPAGGSGSPGALAAPVGALLPFLAGAGGAGAQPPPSGAFLPPEWSERVAAPPGPPSGPLPPGLVPGGPPDTRMLPPPPEPGPAENPLTRAIREAVGGRLPAPPLPPAVPPPAAPPPVQDPGGTLLEYPPLPAAPPPPAEQPPPTPPPAGQAGIGPDAIRRLLTSRNPQAVAYGLQLYRDMLRRPSGQGRYQLQGVGDVPYILDRQTGQATQLSGSGGGGRAPAGFRWSDDRSRLEAIPGGPGEHIAAEAAGRLAMMNTARASFGQARQLFERNWTMGERARAATGRAWLAPEYDQARRTVRAAVEGALRAMTGAAAPQQEVDSYMGMFMPSITDPVEVARQKLDMLERYMQQVESLVTRGRGGPSGPGGPGGSGRVRTYNPQTGQLE